jgi:predicted ATPase
MTPEQFVYWFQGFAELNEEPPNAAQWKLIREHVDTVFFKITPTLHEHVKEYVQRSTVETDTLYPRRRVNRLLC